MRYFRLYSLVTRKWRLSCNPPTKTLLKSYKGNFTMVIGWVLMWQSASIPWLLASRFLTGTGYGFLLEHLKTYLTSTSEPGPSTSFSLRLLNSYSYVGVLLMYSYGSYVSMKTAAVISLIVSLSVLSVVLVLPGTESKIQTDPGLFAAVFRRGLYRERLGLVLLGTFQQFSGVPATIIYTQTVFERSGCPAPKEFSVLYAAVYLVANSVATFLPQSYDKRTVLVCSTLATSLAIVMYVTSIVIEIDASWSYASSVVLFVYLVAHTSGLGNVPVTFVGRFPEEYRVPIGRLFFAMNSLGALLVTKVFQVLMGRYGIEVPFCMFLAVSLAAFLYVYVCLDEEGKR